MVNLIVIGMEKLKIDNGYSLEKEFTKLICINPLTVSYHIMNQVDSCHDYIKHVYNYST